MIVNVQNNKKYFFIFSILDINREEISDKAIKSTVLCTRLFYRNIKLERN